MAMTLFAIARDGNGVRALLWAGMNDSDELSRYASD
jgi:hypothetical protein